MLTDTSKTSGNGLEIAYYYLNTFKRSQAAMRLAAPDAHWVYTDPSDPSLYPKDVASRWNKGSDLLIIEGDIVPTPKDIERMRDCRMPWCTNWYPLGTNRTPFQFGYGFVKFSAGLQAELPYEAVLSHQARRECLLCHAVAWADGDICPDCEPVLCHKSQDTAMWHEMIIRYGLNVTPHNHGFIDHMHLGRRSMQHAVHGIIYWDAEPQYSKDYLALAARDYH